ncbi:hypothetical protein Hanom_Chr03g00203761 [Helianthus anomalus]
MAGPGGGRGGPPARARYFEGHTFFLRKKRHVYVKYYFNWVHTCKHQHRPLTKQFLWF